jgi:SAM-dependent methyltransferase
MEPLTTLFKGPLPLEEGIHRALTERLRVPLAQASNFLPLTAQLYEPLWRNRSIGLLSGGRLDTRRELEMMGRWLEPKPGETVLDAACSAGLYARALLKLEPSLSVHALDFSLPFLRVAKRYALREGIAPTLVHADVRALPYRDGVFDAVVCGGSLNEFTDLERSLREFARVLKPGGRLWLMYLHPAKPGVGRWAQAMARAAGIGFPDPDKVSMLTQAAGLMEAREDSWGVVTLALYQKKNPL